MAKRSKAYRAAAEKIADGVLYTPAEAMRLAKETSVTKFDATVEVVFRLGVDPPRASGPSRRSKPARTKLAATNSLNALPAAGPISIRLWPPRI